MQRMTKDDYYLGIAIAVSKRSTCLRRHYGCVIVKDDKIIATGYNGSPRGEANCCDVGICKRQNAKRYTGYDVCPSVHAEQNALIQANRNDLQNATLYLACEEYKLNEDKSVKLQDTIYDFVEDDNPEPCSMCMKMIKNSGISNIITKRGKINVRN